MRFIHPFTNRKFALRLLLYILFLPGCCSNLYAEASKLESTAGLTNFAFASYLGTGLYTSSGQRVFVIQLPFDYTIIQKTDTRPGWLLKLPITFGLLNFKGLDLENLPNIDNVATLTFLPGIEYQYPITPKWTLIPFADYGFARDLNNKANILVFGTGVKNYIKFNHRGNTLTLGNELLFARERTGNSSLDASYSLFETGLDYRMKTRFIFGGKPLMLGFYYINYYYPNDLIFLKQTENPIRVGWENEVGFTFSNLPSSYLFEKPQFGFGVRIGNGIMVYRLVFGMPF